MSAALLAVNACGGTPTTSSAIHGSPSAAPEEPIAPADADCALHACVRTLYTDARGVSGVAVDDRFVYFMAFGVVKKLPLAGGAPTTLTNAVMYAVADGALLWTDGSGTLTRSPLDGSPSTVLARSLGVESLLVAGTHVHVAVNGFVPPPPPPQCMEGWNPQVCNPTGGNGSLTTMNLADGSIAATYAGGEGVIRAVADADHVAWYDGASANVHLANVGESTVATLATGVALPAAVAIGNGFVYWTSAEDGGAIVIAPIGGGAETTIATAHGEPSAFALDGTTLYFSAGGGLFAMPLAGGAIRTIATSLPNVGALAVGAKGVYAATAGTPGAILEVRTR